MVAPDDVRAVAEDETLTSESTGDAFLKTVVISKKTINIQSRCNGVVLTHHFKEFLEVR